ncbi:MAG: glycosyltransferase family 1 protein [Thermoflexales bacterium]
MAFEAGETVIGIDASRSEAARLTGTERYSRELIAAMLRSGGHRFRLYARAPIADAAPAEVVVIRRARLWTHLGLGPEVGRRPPDALFIPAHVLPISVGLARRPRAVVTVHDLGYRHFPSAHPLRQRLYLDLGTWFSARCAAAIAADSRACAADLTRFYGIAPEKITVAYPGPIPPASLGPGRARAILSELGLAERAFVLFVGTLQPRKNLRRLLQAMALPALAAYDLVVAGGRGWGGEDLEAVAREVGLGARAHFLGYVSDETKAALLLGARALAMPSLHEGFGFPVLEAQMASTPVVASNTSSLPEAAGDGAILVDPLDPAAIAAGLAIAVGDAAARVNLIARGRANVARFSWDTCARQILSLLIPEANRR